MKNLEEKIKQKFELLLKEGKGILQLSGWDGRRYRHHPNDVDYHRWKIEALNLLRKACGEKSDYYQQLLYFTKGDLNTNSYYFKDCYGIVKGAQRDYLAGFVFDLKVLVEAELFDDFLSQANYLLKQGFYVPAASLTGAVLEDYLRKLCDRHNVSYDEDDTNINKLNSELRKKDVYSKLISKEIIAKADIRNNADHGKFEKFNNSDVKDMISWVRRFISDSSK